MDPSGLDLLDDAANFFAGWGDRLTALPDWLGGDSLTQHARRFLGVDEVVDPCSDAYLRGDLVGTVHDFLLTRGRGGGVRQGLAQGGKKAGRRAEQEVSSHTSLPASKAGSSGGPGAGKPFTQKKREEVFARDPDICVFCGMSGATDVDHIIPRSKGGNNTLENAQRACPHCNRSKGAGSYPKTPPSGYKGRWPPAHWPRK